jgi:hypothetical protein
MTFVCGLLALDVPKRSHWSLECNTRTRVLNAIAQGVPQRLLQTIPRQPDYPWGRPSPIPAEHDHVFEYHRLSEHYLSKRSVSTNTKIPEPQCSYSSTLEYSHSVSPDEYDLERSDVDSEFVALFRVPLTFAGYRRLCSA